MIVYPNAKINIGLNIINKRIDGYHDIETIFYPIDLSDILEFIPLTGITSSSIHITGMPVDGNRADNLCIRALELLKHHHDIPPLQIHLHKGIPVGSGLGGGSSDAAFMLKALNCYFNLQIKNEELVQLAAELGSDCSFFVNNTVSFASGVGDNLFPIDLNLNNYYFTIICPELTINTKNAYSCIRPKKPDISLKEAIKQPVKEWNKLIINDFEDVIAAQYPVINKIKNNLYKHGALYASMTGSGSCVYGIFEKPVTMKPYFNEYFVWESFR